MKSTFVRPSILSFLCRWFFFIALIIYTVPFLSAQETEQSPFILTGGIGLTGNMHAASFSRLPGIPSASNGFDGGFGIGGSVYAGMEFIPSSMLFRHPYHLGISLGYTMLSATMKKEEFIANAIIGNEAKQAVVEYSLQATYNVLTLEPAIFTMPFSSLPIAFKLGAQAGIPLGPSYAQKETLLRPAGVTFETGGLTRDVSSGTLPQASSLYAALVVGTRYDLFHTENLTIAPELQYSYALTNVVSSLTWKIHAFRAGVGVQYRLPVSAPPPPPVPPPPPPPPPPAVKQPPTLAIEMFNTMDNIPVMPGDTLKAAADTTRYVSSYTLAPYLFFEKGSAQISQTPADEDITPEKLQAQVLTGIVRYMQRHPDVSITITGSNSSDESELSAQRTRAVATYLQEHGIGQQHIIQKTLKQETAPRYDELREEQRYVSFSFSDERSTIPIEVVHEAITSRDITFVTRTVPTVATEPHTLHGTASLGGTPFQNTDERPLIIALPAHEFRDVQPLTLDYTLTDADRQSTHASVTIYVKSIRTSDVQSSAVSYDAQHTGTRDYIVGYCHFNETEFYAANAEVKTIVQKALQAGETVEILPLTDKFGTEAYNASLAQARAHSAVHYLGIEGQTVQIVPPTSFLFDNATPQGRTLNRAVLVRIR